MVTGDAAYIKKINRSFLISKIIEHGLISRAELAKITGLNKATISVQVADMLSEELIVETQQEHKNLGRRPIMLSLNRKAGYALGIDLDYKQITFTLTDLLGSPLSSDTVDIHISDYEHVLSILIENIQHYQDKCSDSHYGIVGVVVGIHGIVTEDEIINFVPSHNWHNKNLKADIEKGTGLSPHIENNANLCAFAEQVYNHHQSVNLLCVSLYSGIGLGIMINGELYEGYHGYAGEMGHMIVVPHGKPCKCGNKGCWEQYASESIFFKLLSERQNKPDLSYLDIQQWLNEQEPNTNQEMKEYIEYLSIGLNNIINLYNPETIVLNSELLKMHKNALNEIKESLTSSVSHFQELIISDFGKEACVMGACALAIKNFLQIPELKFNINDEEIPKIHVEVPNWK
ncbi:ROK family transcriptional regulator [Halalkalibacter krulwichiae]|uniref:N-acetylglucosamine repressor n=1 Tax=Halalkalibacter krulwichiae TaxID=199441 RepID=A0A1X9MCU4_9BACI|nr:ROK family transcriptional regulator [Halalkalibacter krulwichiae]ARK31259.1 N-acetylglucosamine repressor [Halalkalibacter krulwichiae]